MRTNGGGKGLKRFLGLNKTISENDKQLKNINTESCFSIKSDEYAECN